MAGAEQVVGRAAAAPRAGVAGWAAAWRGWVAAHPDTVRRLLLARTVLLWLGLLHVLLLAILVPDVRPGLKVWLNCYWLLVAWFLLARTKTLPWRGYAALFAVSVPWALVIGVLTTVLSGSPGVEAAGPRTALAAFAEEALKLVPLLVVAVAAPGRVRRFAAADWLIAGVACGLGFQAFEDLVRRIAATHEAGGYFNRFAGEGQGPLSGFPQYGWSPISGGSQVFESGYAGHHVFTGLVAGGIGLGVYLWGRRERAWRIAAVALPVLLWWTVVVDHLAFNAGQTGTFWADGPDPNVPWLIRFWWSVTGHGFGRGWLLLLLLVAALLVDARRIERAARRGLDALAGLPFAPLQTVDTVAGRFARGAFALGAFATRDLAFLLAGLARDPGEPARAGIDRGRRAATFARLNRLDAMPAGSERGTRTLALAALAAVAVAALLLGPALAHAIGGDLNGGGAWLAGLLERLGDWWGTKSTGEKILFGAGIAAIVALSGGSLGLAAGVSGAAVYALDHAHAGAALARDPRAAVTHYVTTTTPAGAALDALAFGLTFAPGNVAGAAAGRAVRSSLDEFTATGAGWAAARGDLLAAAERPAARVPMDFHDYGALQFYTGRGYGRMNAALRATDQPIPPDVRRRIDALDTALGKLPAHDGWVHRGTTLTDAQLSRYVPGATVREPAFTSATTVADQRFSGNVHMYIRSRTGRDVNVFSQVPAEKEVLFRRGTDFTVHERTWDPMEGEWTIVLTEKPR